MPLVYLWTGFKSIYSYLIMHHNGKECLKKGNVNVHCRHVVKLVPKAVTWQWEMSWSNGLCTGLWVETWPCHCVIFRDKILYSPSFSLHQEEWLGGQTYKLLGILDKILRGQPCNGLAILIKEGEVILLVALC